LRKLEIPGLSERFIRDNRINQIDILWLNQDEAKYTAFEIENSTGIYPGIQRLANLTVKMEHINIPTYVIIPDKFRNRARRIFDSPSGKQLGSLQRKFIVYSKLLHYIDLLESNQIRPNELLQAISEEA